LTPDAYFDAPARDQEARKQAKKQPAVVLTVPAPSGMSCINALRGQSNVTIGQRRSAARRVVHVGCTQLTPSFKNALIYCEMSEHN
jgi:uncharacterized metal-binding protein